MHTPQQEQPQQQMSQQFMDQLLAAHTKAMEDQATQMTAAFGQQMSSLFGKIKLQKVKAKASPCCATQHDYPTTTLPCGDICDGNTNKHQGVGHQGGAIH